ncbi:MAG: hypothetical protein GYB66_14440 [Chloroflexi bacterium]|nr:hypothetical protein [Chloroflexota bacterium]
MKRLIVSLMVLGLGIAGFLSSPSSSPASAQSNFCDDLPTIEYGETVTGTITNANSLYGYCFDATAGDELTIDMVATSGDLDTYLVLADPFLEEIFAENDDVATGGTDSQISFTIPSSGTYLVVATRFDFDEGASSGGFRLTLAADGGQTQGPGLGGSTATPNEDDFQINVTCTVEGETTQVIQGGLQFSFINVNPGFSYTVTVFGLEDFDPVLAVEHGEGIGTCNDDEPNAAGSELSVPDFGYVQSNSQTAQVRFTTRRQGDPVNITVGAFGGEGGRFVMVIEGLAIQPASELDGFVIRVPGSVAEEPLAVYMVSRYTSLDASLSVLRGDGLTQAFDAANEFDPDAIDFNAIQVIAECDDAGTGTCADTPRFPSTGSGVVIANGSSYIAGETDPGVVLAPEDSTPILYVFGSSDQASSGAYAIMVIGSVPGDE